MEEFTGLCRRYDDLAGHSLVMKEMTCTKEKSAKCYMQGSQKVRMLPWLNIGAKKREECDMGQ